MSALSEAMKTGAIQLGKFFKNPDDDWIPAMGVVSAAGQTGMVHIAPFFSGDANKELFGSQILPQLIEQMDLVELVLVNSSWTVAVEQWDEENDPRPSEHPERIEVLIITRLSAEGAVQEMAYIDRDPRGELPPVLGEFKQSKGTVSGRITDRAVEVLRERAGL